MLEINSNITKYSGDNVVADKQVDNDIQSRVKRLEKVVRGIEDWLHCQ